MGGISMRKGCTISLAECLMYAFQTKSEHFSGVNEPEVKQAVGSAGAAFTEAAEYSNTTRRFSVADKYEVPRLKVVRT